MYNYTYLCPYQILMIAILTKWLPFYKKNEFYFAAAAGSGQGQIQGWSWGSGPQGGPGGLDPHFRATFLTPPLNLLEQRYLKLSVWFGT